MTDAAVTGAAFGPFQIYPGERRLERDGQPVALGSRAFDLLAALIERPGEVLGKRELLARAWPGLIVDESNLRVHIAALRKALGEGTDGVRYIANVPVRGYCFVAAVTPIGAPTTSPAARPAPGRRPTSLPPMPSRLIGRDDVARRVEDLLQHKRLLTLHGPGGIGKTTVALLVAHAQLSAFDGAVRFLDLAPLSDPALVVSAFGSALGLVPQTSDPTPEILEHLRDRRMLLVLDSCEHLVESVAALVERILREAPDIRLIATSRDRLRIDGEHVVALPPLDRPPDGPSISVPQLMDFAATRLFVDCATAAGHDEPLTDADATLVADMCRKLDGIALAIELAAARVPTYGLAQTAALLDGRLRLLWRGRRTALPRHQTLHAVLDWSHALIEPVERVALRRMACFAGPFTLAGAQAVTADDDVSPERVAEALDALVAKSLVSLQPAGGLARYRLLDTTRAYARERLAESGEADAIAQRHAAFVCAALEDKSAWLPTGNRVARQAAERAFLGDVQAALTWSFAQGREAVLAQRLAAGAADLFISLSLLHDCRRWTEAALALPGQERSGTPVEMQLQASLGHALMFTTGNDEQAHGALQRALAIAERRDDLESQFRLLSRLHLYHRRVGELQRLLPIADRLDTLASRIGSPTGIAAAHTLKGLSHHLVGEQQAARRHLETALHLAEFDRVSPTHFAFHRNPYIALSRTLWLLGYPDQAVAAAQPLDKEAASPDMVTHCIALIWGSAVFKWVGDWARVTALAEQLIAFSRDHALKTYVAVGLGLRGEALIGQGHADAGAELLRSAMATLRADRYDLYVTGFGGSLAAALAGLGRIEQARAVIDATLDGLRRHGSALEAPDLLRVRAEVLLLQGDAEGAESDFEAAIAEADQQHALSFRLRAVTGLASLMARRGDRAGARQRLHGTLSRFTEGHQTADLRAAAALLAELSAPGIS